MSAQSSPLGSVTPEGVELDFAYATVGSRGIAYLLDLLLLALVLVLFSIAEAIFGFSGFVPGWVGLTLLLLLAFLVQFGYPIGFETLWRGRTPGKAAMGLRVVTTEGAPVGFRHATVRAVVGLVELLPTLGVPAIATSILSRRGQRLGDLAAGTVVLRERRGGPAPTPRTFTPPVGLETYTEHLDVSRVGPADYAMLRDTLVRLDQLAPSARRSVAEAVADRLLHRVAPPPPAGVPAHVWLHCVAAAVQQRRRPGGSAPTITGPGPAAGRPGPEVSAPSAQHERRDRSADAQEPPDHGGGFTAPD